jgi:general secretion pathway protein A
MGHSVRDARAVNFTASAGSQLPRRFWLPDSSRYASTMVLDFYGLAEPPFSLTPDPRFVFLSDRHREALAHLVYGIGQGGAGGFVQLTGEVGTGKTTLSRLLLEQLPDNVRPALILNPRLSAVELVEAIAEELGVDLASVRGSQKGVVDALNRALLETHAAGKAVVAIIDEAQNLSDDALEQVRLLTNLETARQKLLQIVLLGQPELRDKLAQPHLRQLAQRITARYHLAPLDAEETESYLRHRIAVAGGKRFPFAADAVRALHRHSGGVPRLINILAERALLAGYVGDAATVGRAMVDHAAREVRGLDASPTPNRRWAIVALALAALASLIGVGWWFWPMPPSERGESIAPAAEPDAGDAPLLAPIAPPEPEPEAAPDTSTLFDSLGAMGPGSRTAAWESLLGRWDAIAADADVASTCPSRIRGGLRCTRIRQSLDRLAVLDRPLMLVMRAGEAEVHAQLVGWRGSRVVIDAGQGLRELAPEDFDAVWSGDTLAVWRESESFPDAIGLGDRGASVVWVLRQLERFDRLPDSREAPDVFDAGITEAVRGLQSDFGLTVDGIVGPETQWLLSTRDAGGPRLVRLPE